MASKLLNLTSEKISKRGSKLLITFHYRFCFKAFEKSNRNVVIWVRRLKNKIFNIESSVIVTLCIPRTINAKRIKLYMLDTPC